MNLPDALTFDRPVRSSKESLMVEAAIFDIDGTQVDSVDLHALAWHEAFAQFGHRVTVDQARSQIGKGGDRLLPVFLSDDDLRDHGSELEAWRGERFKTQYLPLVRPFSAVPELFARLRQSGIRIAVGSSAKREELEVYLRIAKVADLVDVTVSSEDVNESKPAPDVFQVALQKLGLGPDAVVVIGDSPYDAQAAARAGARSIGFLSGAFPEDSLRRAGCISIYPGPAGLYVALDQSVFSSKSRPESENGSK
jgi:beta-phosphoglucomutase-like phosphatase (HAD superfamily)